MPKPRKEWGQVFPCHISSIRKEWGQVFPCHISSIYVSLIKWQDHLE